MSNFGHSIILLQPAPYKLEDTQNNIFSTNFLQLLEEASTFFDSKINSLYTDRTKRKALYANHNTLPNFNINSNAKRTEWKIKPLPPRLKCRHIEIGDVSPSNTAHFVDALNSDAQSVQVDFDDGHCPTWKNQIQGFHNIIQVINGNLNGAPCNINTCPILMLRPRAWNIIEHNILVNGKEIPGAFLDFMVLIYHCGKKLASTGSGPFFYLSKVESASESKLWNEIFVWTQNKLDIPQGTIKACVLIENILSVFEAEEILYELKEHSLGLNCGIWDYIASILVKFGNRRNFILPDRMKYVSFDNQFLKSYLLTVIKICHKRGAPATGGMVASILKPGSDGNDEGSAKLISKIIDTKQKEIMAGVDGFLIYDIRLLPVISKLWKKQCGDMPNQLQVLPNAKISAKDLLTFPKGGIFLESLEHNIAVSVLFIYHWLSGVGHFFYNGQVEDSATAEISRCQVWQCLRHGVILEDTNKPITYILIDKLIEDFVSRASKTLCRSSNERKRLSAAKYMCKEIFISMYPPDFITTHLNDSHKFRTIHNKTLLNGIRSNL
ncbi:uncharacterized protein LOC143914439 [Arctopsyche grandis]|uniref:uncharacterized protein LOC143914439 n=1 Tax=Arctopsyche grandis TaxID=121162 RepID=UPI00406D9F4B